MTLRGGGRPRDPRTQAHSFEARESFGARWNRDPRRPGERRRRGPRNTLMGLLRFLLFAILLGAFVLAVSLTALRPIVSTALAGWAYDNSAALRVPFVAELIRERYADALNAPAGSDSSDVTFTVEPGDDVKSVAARLEDEGLVKDSRAFIFQATMRRLADRLTAGNFRLTPTMTPDGIVTGLIENRIVITVVSKTFRESLRIEQMATLIQTWDSGLSVDANEFREIVTDPPAEMLADNPWLKTSGLPDGASLEGYLFPSTYDLRPETTTEDLVRMMLDKFVEEVGADRVADPKFYRA